MMRIFKRNAYSERNATGMKRAGILFVSFVALFLLLSVRTKADGNYSSVLVKIPFQCEKISGEKDIPYLITLNAISEGAPDPNVNQISLGGGEKGSFKISVTEPGTFAYRMKQKKGTVEKAVYDEKEYDVYLYVVNDGEKDLSCSVSVVSVDGKKIPNTDEIIFQNILEPDPDIPSSEDPPASEEHPTPDDLTNGKNIRVGGLISGKTGENNPLFVGLFITSILSLIAGAGVYIAVKNKKEEQ